QMYANQQLQASIKGEIIGKSYPYDTHNVEEVESYIKQLYYRIKRIQNIICEAELDHYRCGYASLVKLFCYRNEGVLVVQDKGEHGVLEYEKAGVLLNVSRLAPVFIYGEDERSETVRVETNEVIGGGYSPLPGQINIFNRHKKFD